MMMPDQVYVTFMPNPDEQAISATIHIEIYIESNHQASSTRAITETGDHQ